MKTPLASPDKPRRYAVCAIPASASARASHHSLRTPQKPSRNTTPDSGLESTIERLGVSSAPGAIRALRSPSPLGGLDKVEPTATGNDDDNDDGDDDDGCGGGGGGKQGREVSLKTAMTSWSWVVFIEGWTTQDGLVPYERYGTPLNTCILCVMYVYERRVC